MIYIKTIITSFPIRQFPCISAAHDLFLHNFFLKLKFILFSSLPLLFLLSYHFISFLLLSKLFSTSFLLSFISYHLFPSFSFFPSFSYLLTFLPFLYQLFLSLYIFNIMAMYGLVIQNHRFKTNQKLRFYRFVYLFLPYCITIIKRIRPKKAGTIDKGSNEH